MKTIKQALLSGILTLVVFSSVLFTSCKDKCGSIVCQNSSACSNNVCICPTGYYGNTCGSSYTSQYVGTYSCSQKCLPASIGAKSWESSVVVSATNSGYTVTINNFGGSNVSYDAIVDSLNNIIIPAGSYSVAGTGKYAVDANGKGSITLNYSETVGTAGTYSCTMAMLKK